MFLPDICMHIDSFLIKTLIHQLYCVRPFLEYWVEDGDQTLESADVECTLHKKDTEHRLT